MKQHYTTLLLIVFIIIDFITVLCAGQFAFFVNDLFIGSNSLYISWGQFLFLFPFVFVFFNAINQLYTRRMPFYKEVQLLFMSTCWSFLALIVEFFLLHISDHLSRLFVFLFAFFSFVFLIIVRYLTKKCMQLNSLLQIPVIIIGAGKTAELLANTITNDAGMGYKIVGLLEDNKVQHGLLDKFPVLGTFDDAEKVITETGVNRVFIAAPGLEDEKLGMLIYRVQPLVENIGVIPNFVGIPTGSVEVESVFSEKLLILRLKNNLARPLNRMVKTIFDYTLTLIGTICISPILLIIAAWIYYDSPGPVIFKHIRIGKDGKPFPCYKFRSMCVDSKEKLAELLANDPAAREEWERDFKLKNDPRITRSGAFLRKTSLDELPQIFNVLKGEMSLVGPRPIIHEELERYGEFVGDYLMVKPGITGMWQVSGRSDIEYAERVQLDTWYVRNWSVWVDIVLLFKTFAVVAMRKSAY